MDYEKEYKKLKAGITNAYLYAHTDSTKAVLESLLPELKESEDELKWLTQFIQEEAYSLSLDIRDDEDRIKLKNLQRSLAWLEKQGKKEQDARYEDLEELLAADNIYQMAMNDEMVREAKEKAVNALHGMCIGRLLGIEKQGEQNLIMAKSPQLGDQKPADKVEPKFKVGDKIRRKTPSSCDKDMQVARIEKDYYICNHIGKFSSEVVPFSKESRYELVEQKSADKVEPKFKAGDWIVNNTNKDVVFLIKSIISGYCTLEDIKGNIVSPCLPPCESDFHLWTIQDAKDGDVLEFGDHGRLVVGIVSHINKSTGKVDVCCLLEANNFKVGIYYALDTIKPHPAPKERCDLLFSKMKEASYEWDAEKKELKEIE